MNVVYLTLRGMMFKLTWGPNYADPMRGEYVEISLGELVIWTTSTYMYAEMRRKRALRSKYVIENQTIPLRTVTYGHPIARKLGELNLLAATSQEGLICEGRGQWYPHDRQAMVVELVTHKNQPLYTELLQIREVTSKEAAGWLPGIEGDWLPNTRYEEALEELQPNQYNIFAHIRQGPRPRPDALLVTSWKWVWRGLDPEIDKYPSPLYMKLLGGRVIRGDWGRILIPPPITVVNLNRRKNQPTHRPKQGRRHRPLQGPMQQ